MVPAFSVGLYVGGMADVFECVSSEVLLDSPILGVRRDQVVMPGGSVKPREVVEHFGAVAVVAVDDQMRVRLVRQFRAAVGARLWELPAGLLDFQGESALQAAQRELVEEAGLEAESWAVLTDIVTSPGFCDEVVRIYLARGLRQVDRPVGEDDEEAAMEFEWVGLDQARDWALSGRLANGICVAGVLAAWAAVEGGVELREADVEFPLRPHRLAKRRARALQEAGLPVDDLKRVPPIENVGGC